MFSWLATSAPEGWHEIPSVVELGATWNRDTNSMIPHFLPLFNIYNFYGTGVGWASQMRLDRILIKSHAFDFKRCTAEVIANKPVHDKAVGREPLSGAALRQNHRNLPWEEYLFPSDHCKKCPHFLLLMT